MALIDKKISEGQISSYGVVSAPDKLTGTAAQNKAIFDRLIQQVVSVSMNDVIDELTGPKGASNIGTSDGKTMEQRLDELVKSYGIQGIRVNKDNVIEITLDGINWTSTGSSGHLILDKNGKLLPQRSRLQFLGDSVVTDNGTQTIVSAIKGDTGPQGIQGLQGERGPQGLEGNVWTPAISQEGQISWNLSEAGGIAPASRNIRGPQGVQGIQGPQGDQGPVGTTGLQGIQGVQGSRGEMGPQGDQGPAGPSGPQGIQGIQGTRGPKGDTGEQGSPGQQGSAGAQGPAGSQGIRGEKGTDGNSFTILALFPTLYALQNAHPIGEVGQAYAVGTAESNIIYFWDTQEQTWVDLGPLQGPVGPQGIQGIQGPQGIEGARGPAGANGVPGPQGEQGPQGIQGERGPLGPKGDIGLMGSTGPKGEQGVAGPQGAQGAKGSQGLQGPQGTQGIQGPAGPMGPKGDPANINGILPDSTGKIVLAAANIGAIPYQVVASGDFNTMVTPGVYTMRTAAANKPSTGTYYSLWVNKSDSGSYVQQFAIMEGTTRAFIRYLSSTAWSAWAEVSTTGQPYAVATHTKSGTVHTLTLNPVPASTPYTLRFKATADFVEGDTIKVNATAVTTKLLNGDTLPGDAFKNGAIVILEVDGAIAFFRGGVGGVNETLPTQVSSFSATIKTTPSISLSWANPVSSWEGTLIVRKAGSTPAGPRDGVQVYNGTGTTFNDTGITYGVTYYYRAFPYNSRKQYQTLLTGAVVNKLINKMPTFTGSSTSFGDSNKGRIELLTSGTLSIYAGTYDVFILDGGKSGTKQTTSTTAPTSLSLEEEYTETHNEEQEVVPYCGGPSVCSFCPTTTYYSGGNGGNGGKAVSLYGKSIPAGSLTITIGASNGTSTISGGVSFTTSSATAAYSGGGKAVYNSASTSQTGGANGGTNGSLGTGTTTKPFGGDATEFVTPLSGGGASIAYSSTTYSGGNSGGGSSGSSGSANTGGGGGGYLSSGTATSGGSGKIIIRWGY